MHFCFPYWLAGARSIHSVFEEPCMLPRRFCYWRRLTALMAIVALTSVAEAQDRPNAAVADQAAAILRACGIPGGLIVHLHCGDAALTSALRHSEAYLVHGLADTPEQVAAARKRLREAGAYGGVSIELLKDQRLPYIDNFVNLVVAEDLGGVPMAEIQRVLCPRGVAYIKQNGQWQKSIKPVPKEIDDWTHYFHDATGNAVAHDSIVAPPERLQWVGSPRWSRHHDRMASMSALVSSLGRMYYIMDEGSRISIHLPSKWQLIARDAFNGTPLWKRPIEKWHDQMWPLKSGPTQLARRLVADGQRIYVTLGFHAPVTCIDGRSGETLQVYEGTASAEEILLHAGKLLTLTNPKASELDDYAPKFNVGDQRRVAEDYAWNEQPREIQCLDAASGKLLWKVESKVAPLTLATDGQRVVYHDGDRIFCLDLASGKQLWATEPAARRRLVTFNFGPRLVLHQDVVLYAGGEGKMRGFDSASGKMLWEADHAPSGYQSPQDLIVTGGLVWVAPTTSGRDSGIYKGRDIHTGEVKIEFPPDIDTYWFHHRCYIAKATDRFIIPSRTGIELVDFKAQHWDINHWVRGGCLYGVMPCNGLLYAPPHNCACYPEAKLSGFNALAPAAATSLPPQPTDADRLEKGPAYAATIVERDASEEEWPTYRHDNARSGYSKQKLADDLSFSWENQLTGRLSSLVVADDKVFVAQIDQHTVHALDQKDGRSVWTFTAGGRIDSPPTIWKGRVLFGSADGWVYCLRSSDGELVWRYQAAPVDRRLMAFEQLESVWPVHGSILVEGDAATFVVGRSSFLDGGMWLLRLDARNGQKLSETVLNDRNPETGGDLQEKVATLQMPVALADVLSSDGKHVYLRSQKFDKQGKRLEIGPVSGVAAEQGGAQGGEDRHLFAPMGFLDDSWFHRSYWVYGKSFAGGHNGYYQAGKHTPSGRILAFNDKEVFGYARQPQYYRWTTPLEHQMFAASRDAFGTPQPQPARGQAANTISFKNKPSLNPENKPLSVEAWVDAKAPGGAILSHGGPANGYALVIQGRKPSFVIRSSNKISQVTADERLGDGWHHVAGVLDAEKKLRLYVDGQLSAEGQASGLVAAFPKQLLEIGGDSGGPVGNYQSPFPLVGAVDEVRIYHRALAPEEVKAAATDPEASRAGTKGAVLAISFDAGNAKDESGHQNDGALGSLPTDQGKVGTAVLFPKPATGAAAQPGGVAFEHRWTRFTPVFARAMVLTDNHLIVAGPPDDLDEEYALERLAAKDPAIHENLKLQDDNLEGKNGARMWLMSIDDGTRGRELEFESVPVWDGIASAYGKLFMATTDGRVICIGK
jgi:outer membrane protein assembly factor BamB